jgi:hypothetical protein
VKNDFDNDFDTEKMRKDYQTRKHNLNQFLKGVSGINNMVTYTATPSTTHSGHDIFDQNGHIVALVPQGARIAALMAAAPDLLAALETLKREWDLGRSPLASEWSKAREAIARAKGAV